MLLRRTLVAAAALCLVFAAVANAASAATVGESSSSSPLLLSTSTTTCPSPCPPSTRCFQDACVRFESFDCEDGECVPGGAGSTPTPVPTPLPPPSPPPPPSPSEQTPPPETTRPPPPPPPPPPTGGAGSPADPRCPAVCTDVPPPQQSKTCAELLLSGSLLSSLEAAGDSSQLFYCHLSRGLCPPECVDCSDPSVNSAQNPSCATSGVVYPPIKAL